jgi:AraC-like DNA-binding protein
MILTTLPDLPPRPETRANAEFRRGFYARWGRENAIVCGRAAHAEYAPWTQALSVKLAWGGREVYRLRRRELAVEDDRWLVLNEGETYGSVLAGERPAWTFAVFLRPGLADEVRHARRQSLDRALDAPGRARAPAAFSEHLRPHDARVTPQLVHLREAVQAGERDEQWLEEQALLLADALLDAEAADACRVQALGCARPATRAELARRVRLAADHILTHYAQPLDLEALARVACLSPFHLVRWFRALAGATPHAWLVAQRAAAARRALARGERDLDRVAARAGFGCRSSLRRALARHPA